MKIVSWLGSSRKALLKRWHLRWSWYGIARLLVGWRGCSKWWVSCVVSMRWEVLRCPWAKWWTYVCGVVKALVNIAAQGLWHHSDSDLRALQPPIAQTCSVSEQRLSHHRNSWPCCYQYTLKQLQNIYACWQREIGSGGSGFTPV